MSFLPIIKKLARSESIRTSNVGPKYTSMGTSTLSHSSIKSKQVIYRSYVVIFHHDLDFFFIIRYQKPVIYKDYSKQLTRVTSLTVVEEDLDNKCFYFNKEDIKPALAVVTK